MVSPKTGVLIMTLSDKTIVVSGALGAIGRAIVDHLAGRGATVHALDLQADGRATTGVRTVALDVTDETAVAAFFAGLSRVDGLVNNAGIAGEAALADLDRALWERVFAVNVTGHMLMAKHAVPRMPGGSAIVGISSIAGLRGYAERAAYCASKAAIMGLTRALAVELAPRDIRVNCIAPGTIDTPWIDRLIEEQPNPAQARIAFPARAPMKRMGTTTELAGLVAFLVAEDSRFITGAVIPCDGGASVMG